MHRFFTLLFGSLFCLVNTVSGEAVDEVVAHEAGRAIYNYRCYFCHGYSGDAKTLTSTYVNPKPRDFSNTGLDQLPRSTMLEVVAYGKPNTAMIGFSRVLNAEEIALVVDFVRVEFMQNQGPNTRYHTKENGWDKHQRYQIAFPFATGEIPLDTPWQQLTEEQRRGKRLYLESCITCHDRAIVKDEGETWSSQSISYPRNNFSYSDIDAFTSASIYAIHDISPTVDTLSAQALAGKTLWLDNCAFCHAADGSGQNWIGSFLEPKPRDLTNPQFMASIDHQYLRHAIREGLVNTSMPAWKSVLNDKQIEQIISYINEAFHPVTQ